MKSKNKTLQYLGFIALAFAGFASTTAHAATDTWQGSAGSTDWATNGNWTYSTGSAIASGDSLVFTSANASASTTLTNTLATSFNVAGITYNAAALSYTMTGNAFNLTGGITNSSGNLQTISNDIALSTAVHAITATSGNIALGGAFSGATGSVTFSGPGTTTLSGTNTFNINQGNFGQFFVGASAAAPGNVSITGATTVNSTGTASTNGGQLTILGTSTLTIQTGGSLLIDSVISNGGSSIIGQNALGTSTLRVNGGSLTINGAQGFVLGNNLGGAAGVLTIDSGTATINRGSTTATDIRSFIALGRDNATASGTINLNGGTLATDRNFVRDGSATAGAGTANFVLGGGTLKALANQTDWLNSSTKNTNQLALSSVTTTSANSTIDSNGFTVAINNNISGAGGFKITSSSGAGTVTFGGANIYSGATTVNSGTLALSGSISSSSALALGGGTLSYTKAGNNTQTFASTAVNGGHSTVTNATGTNTVNLAAITRSGNGLLNISSLTGTTNTSNVVDSTGILGTWVSTGTGTGLTYAAGGSGGAITAYTGTAATTAADVTDTTGAANYDVAAVGDLGAGASFNTLRYTGEAGSITGDFTANGLMNAGTGAVTYSGNVTIGASKELVILGNTQGTILSGVISDNVGGASSITYGGPGAGTLGLDGANTYTGNTTINAGTLTLGASGSIANSPVIAVRSGATLDVSAKGGWSVQGIDSSNRQMLTGSGSVTGATTIGNFGTHNAGDNGVGKQTLSSSLTYDSGSIFEWDLAATPATTGRGTAYDAVNAASLGNTTGAIFRVVLNGAQDFSATFWNTNQTWTDIFKTGDAGTNLSFASIFSGGVQYYNGSGVLTGVTSTEGAFTMSGSTLTWTAVPEPTTALSGLLLTAGLLRRRRKN
jgi:fibronectin-binding autotransporter adhesin